MTNVAVIIPCFNDGLFVQEAVQSARSQNPAELVVVDDGSDDSQTLEVLRRLADEGVRVIRQTNAGLSAARMAGVHGTTAPYVMVLDSDDQVADGALERMSGALDASSSLDVVWGDVVRFGKAGYRRYPKGKTLDPWRMTFLNELVGTTMIRRSSLLAVGAWTHRQAMEDWDLWMRMAFKGMVGRHVGGVTILYRVNGPRMYQTAMRDFDEGYRALQIRNAELFAHRKRNRKFSGAPILLKALWTASSWVPFPPRWQRYVYFGLMVVCEPERRRRRRP